MWNSQLYICNLIGICIVLYLIYLDDYYNELIFEYVFFCIWKYVDRPFSI